MALKPALLAMRILQNVGDMVPTASSDIMTPKAEAEGLIQWEITCHSSISNGHLLTYPFPLQYALD